MFQRQFCIKWQAFSHNTPSHHRDILTHSHHTTIDYRHTYYILHDTAGIFNTFYIIPQPYWHHTTSHHQHNHTIQHNKTGIFTSYYITQKAPRMQFQRTFFAPYLYLVSLSAASCTHHAVCMCLCSRQRVPAKWMYLNAFRMIFWPAQELLTISEISQYCFQIGIVFEQSV